MHLCKKGGRGLWVLTVFLFLHLACVSSLAGGVIRLGWAPTGTLLTTEDAAGTFARYLSGATGRSVVPVRLPGNGALVSGLESGSIHLAVLPPGLWPRVQGGSYPVVQAQVDGRPFSMIYAVGLAGRPLSPEVPCPRTPVFCPAIPAGKGGGPAAARHAVEAVLRRQADHACITASCLSMLSSEAPFLSGKVKAVSTGRKYPLPLLVASSSLANPAPSVLSAILSGMKDDISGRYCLLRMGITGFGPPAAGLFAPAQTDVAVTAGPGQQSVGKRPVKASPGGHGPRKKAHGGQRMAAGKKSGSSGTVSPKASVIKNEAIGKENISHKGSILEAGNKDQTISSNATGVLPAQRVKGTFTGKSRAGARDAWWNLFFEYYGRDRGDYYHVALLAAPLVLLVLLLAAMAWTALVKRGKITVVAVERDMLVGVTMAKRNELVFRIEAMDTLPVKDMVEGYDNKLDWLAQAGWSPGIRRLGIVSANRTRVRYCTFPPMPYKEVHAAIEWKLRAENVPYNPEVDEIWPIVLEKGGKDRQMAIMAQVFDRGELAWLYRGEDLMVDEVISIEACLLTCIYAMDDTLRKKRFALIYRLNPDEAVMIINDSKGEVMSRRLYMDVNGDAGERGAVTRHLAGHVRQTLTFYEKMTGQGVGLLFVAENCAPYLYDAEALSGELGITAKRMDFPGIVIEAEERFSESKKYRLVLSCVARTWLASSFSRRKGFSVVRDK